MREALGCHLDRGTRVGIAPDVPWAFSCREISEAAKLDSITSGQCGRNFSKDSDDDSLRLAWGEVGLPLNKLQNELGPNHEDLITYASPRCSERGINCERIGFNDRRRNYQWFRC